VIEVSLVAPWNAPFPMLVTLARMVTTPTQLEFEVTTSFEIVTDPEVEQLTFPDKALAGVAKPRTDAARTLLRIAEIALMALLRFSTLSPLNWLSLAVSTL